MTQLYFDWAGYATGVQPTGWTERFDSAGSWQVVAGVGVGGTNGLQYIPGTAARHGLSCDALDGVADLEIAYRFISTVGGTGTSNDNRVFARGSGADGTTNTGVVVGPVNTILRTIQYVNGAATTTDAAGGGLVANSPYWARVKISGTSVQQRIWADGTAEPTTWAQTVTNTTVTAGGWAGVFLSVLASTKMTYDCIGFGWNGDSAPTQSLVAKPTATISIDKVSNVEPGDTVTITLGGVANTGSIVSRTLTQTAGPSVVLTTVDDLTRTFEAPANLSGTTLTFSTTTTDSAGTVSNAATASVAVLQSTERVVKGGVEVPVITKWILAAQKIFETFSRSDADTLSTETVTVTTTQQATSTLTGATQLTPDDAKLRYGGAGNFSYGATFPDTLMYQPKSLYPNTWGNPSAFFVEFMLTGSVFEMLFKYMSTASMYRLKIDGKSLTDLPQSVKGVGVGARHVIKFDFGTVATRRITIEVTTTPFGGIFIPPGATVTAVAPYKKRVIAMGDSIMGGSTYNTAVRLGTWSYRADSYLGIDDMWNSGIGATGYVAAGTAVNFAARMQADVVDFNPDGAIIWGGFNDRSSPQADIAAAADNAFATLRNGLPRTPIVVIGCWAPVVTPDSAMIATDETLRIAAAQRSLCFVSPVTGKIYNDLGEQIANLGAWIDSAEDVAAYVGGDGVHPTDAGHNYIANKIADALQTLNI